jgi:amidase
MGVQGPLARSAYDLELLFDLMAGPDAGEDAAWQLSIPPARAGSLADFRVAVIPPLSLTPLAAEVATAVDDLSAFLSRAGAKVEVAMPDLDLEAYFADYNRLLWAMMSQAQSREEREEQAERFRQSGDPVMASLADGLTMDVPTLTQLLGRREAARAAWRAFFRDWDVLVGPISMDVAFKHDDTPFFERMRVVDGLEVPYVTNIVYPMIPIFAGQPATAFPAGIGKSSGLPVGLQAIGPYLEDHTPIRFAQLLEQEWRGFLPPPDFA